jgi:hypothetical protein
MAPALGLTPEPPAPGDNPLQRLLKLRHASALRRLQLATQRVVDHRDSPEKLLAILEAVGRSRLELCDDASALIPVQEARLRLASLIEEAKAGEAEVGRVGEYGLEAARYVRLDADAELTCAKAARKAPRRDRYVNSIASARDRWTASNVAAVIHQLVMSLNEVAMVQGENAIPRSANSRPSIHLRSILDLLVRRGTVMTNRTTRYLRHHSARVKDHTVCPQRRTTRPSSAGSPDALSRPGVWDRALDGSATKANPIHDVCLHLFDIVARLAFALFITSGFAAGLCLNNGMTLSSPNLIKACGGVFLWALALTSCTTGRGR